MHISNPERRNGRACKANKHIRRLSPKSRESMQSPGGRRFEELGGLRRQLLADGAYVRHCLAFILCVGWQSSNCTFF